MDNQETNITKMLQDKQLEMLKELDRVCKLIGVEFYLSSGSCLGALRHSGFIPWDDDIDVYMRWEDAEKLSENQNLFDNRYFVQNRLTDPGYGSASYGLRDSSTSFFYKGQLPGDYNHGIHIDIYILYPYPDNWFAAHKVILDSFIYRVLLAKQGPQNHGFIAKLLGTLVTILYKGDRADAKIEKIENEYKYNGGKNYYATYFGRDATLFYSIVYPQEWFKNPARLRFEDMIVNCPHETGKYCKLQYGESYMKLPPVDKRKPHTDTVFISFDEPYTKFKGKYY